MVEKIAQNARTRKAAQGEVEGQGRDVFLAAGMEDVLGTRGTIDVGTKCMEPVVQEHIKPKVHAEYTTIIDREIHKHHVYPCVQPVEDPDPIVLEPRHRIFSVVDGKAHEVEGDAAAIEMMGQEAFERGQKEVRHVRNPVLVEQISEAAAERSETMSQKRGSAQVNREGDSGGHVGHWHDVVHGPAVPMDDDDDTEAADEQRTMGVAI